MMITKQKSLKRFGFPNNLTKTFESYDFLTTQQSNVIFSKKTLLLSLHARAEMNGVF